MNLFLALFGSVRLHVTADHRTKAMDVCLQNSIPYSGFYYDGDGSISFCVSPLTERKLKRLFKNRGIEATVIDASGLPFFVWQMRRRMGLVTGSAIALCLLICSSFFVWDVEVTGNRDLTVGEVKELLADCSFGVGTFIPGVKIRELENRILMTSDELSWVAVNLSGTVAQVQVIERQTPPAPEEDLRRPANLIAACDGQIEFLQLYRGNAVVTTGQAVKKGELLVSGIYDSQVVGFRYTRAAGAVMARTEHTFCIEIPLSYTEKVYTDTKCREIALKFFDFSLEFFKSTGNSSDTCDIIKEDTEFAWFGSRPLPLSLSVTTARMYTEQSVTRTREEALNAAYAQLERELSALSANAELLQKNVQTEMSDTAVILTCTVSCIENIAVQSEFEIRE